MTLFDWLNQILLYKKDWEEFDETEQKTFIQIILLIGEEALFGWPLII